MNLDNILNIGGLTLVALMILLFILDFVKYVTDYKFTVEIRKLAEKSKETSLKINQLVSDVQLAFKSLSDNSIDILDYIDTNVKKDYESLLEFSEQYKKDAEFVEQFSDIIKDATIEIAKEMKNTNDETQNISAMSEESVASSQEISSSMNENVLAIEEISKAAQNQAELAERLNSKIQEFKI